MVALAECLYSLWGHRQNAEDLVALFSVRLDESGTDGRSPYTAVAGAVATLEQWQTAEDAWNELLNKRGLDAFHFKEYRQRIGPYAQWSDLTYQRFTQRIEKIVKSKIAFRVAVGVEDAIHAEIKQRMKGISGFSPDSNYSLCLRYLAFLVCKNISDIDLDSRVSFLLEDGPWAAGAVGVYSKMSRMGPTKYLPVGYQRMLAGIAVAPKGETRTLELADYLVGVAHQRMLKRKFTRQHNPQISILLNSLFLERWYQQMVEEKQKRRAYRDKKFRKIAASSREQSS